MKTAARRVILGAILMTISFSLYGCYTVLKRPGGVMEAEDRYLGEGYGEERWVHPDYLWYDPFYRWYYPDAYGHWRYYYSYPWWWNEYWFWHPDPGRPRAPVSTDRHIWDDRRGPGWSSSPSAPRSPSTASQPKGDRGEDAKRPSPESSRKDPVRRRPDWNEGQGDRSDSDLEQQSRQQDEQDDGGTQP
jgi:hypothetical protein